MSYYTKVLKCPNKCSKRAQARYFPAQDELPSVIVCSNCGAQWSSTSHDLQKIIDEHHLFDVPVDVIEGQKR